MDAERLPTPDYIKELAEFWDSHDVTDFEAVLETVEELVFRRDAWRNPT